MVVNHEFCWPVRVHAQAPDRDFTVRFRLLRPGEQLLMNAEGLVDADAAVRVLLTGWNGLQDPSGRPLPFTQASVERVIADPEVGDAVVRAMVAAFMSLHSGTHSAPN